MSAAQRGRRRTLKKAVPLNGVIAFGFTTSDLSGYVETTALTALGQKDPSTFTIPIVYGANKPKAARFAIKNKTNPAPINEPATITTFGDGTQIAAIEAAGWRLIKPVQPAALGGGARLQGVAIKMTGGLYAYETVPKADVATYAAVLGWETTLTQAERNKLIVKCPKLRPPRVKKVVNGSMVYYPCAQDKLAAAIANTELGFMEVLDQPELVGIQGTIATGGGAGGA